MWKSKYTEKPYEVVLFSQRVLTFLDTINLLFEQGVRRLDFGMNQWKNVDKKPSFDAPIKPYPYEYNEKNLYVDASNRLWLQNLWDVTYPSISELYFSALLERVKAFKKDNNEFDFNKGIIYANLGVAQSSQMKLDEGFANILKALHEDFIYLPATTTPEDNLRKSGLFTQFEDRYVKVYLERIIAQLGMPKIPDPKNFVEAFMESLNNDQRVFFDYTFAKNIRSWEIWKEKENGFTANRLLAYMQDFCLFNEDFLKSKFKNPNPNWLLDRLIKEAGFKVSKKGCRATKIQELDSKLLKLASSNQPIRCLKTLMTIRNYSSHNIGGGTSNNYFYAHYEEILKELIRAMCEIALLPKPITPITTAP